MHICDFGCGQEANYQLKNGKWCCSKSWNSCPSMRKKNSQKRKEQTLLYGTPDLSVYTNTIKPCSFCGNTYTLTGLRSHEAACYLNPKNLVLCPVCGTPVKNYRTARFCSQRCSNIGRKHTQEAREKISKAINHRRELDPLYRQVVCNARACQSITAETKHKISKSMKQFFIKHPERCAQISIQTKGRPVSKRTREKLSAVAKERRFGGHTSKRAIYYAGPNGVTVFLQSSYEVRVASILDSKHIYWERPKPLMWLDAKGKTHRYYPDFYIPACDLYLDPKNDYLAEKHKDKISRVCQQNNVSVLILREEDLTIDRIITILKTRRII